MIEIENLTKTYHTSDGAVEALKNVSLKIEDGDIFGIIGMSGAGKSTLVRCINMLERPDSGSVRIDGCDMCALSQKELRRARRSITMIFQGFNLLMQRNCLANVCFPLELEGMKRADARRRAYELLETVGLADKAGAYPSQLSGGQQPARLPPVPRCCFATRRQARLTRQRRIPCWSLYVTSTENWG